MIDISLGERRKEIGLRIAKERKKADLTHDELADEIKKLLGIRPRQSTISMWEHGKSFPDNIEMIFAMSKIFGCDCGYLLCDYDEKTHDSKDMCNATGLSEESINTLCNLKSWGVEAELTSVIDGLISDLNHREKGVSLTPLVYLIHWFLAYKGSGKTDKKKKAADEAAEAAKLKTVRQYADGVYMPTKEATFSENAHASYRMFLDRHILPVLGETLLTDVTPAMISKLLIDFQKSGKAHASAVKLYNILNGLFDMAFMDDSIPISPMLKVKRPAPRKDEAPKEESEKALTAKELNRVLSCVAQEPLKWQAYITTLPPTAERVEANCAPSNGLI